MTTIFKSFFSVLFFALMTVQLSAQCTESTGDLSTVISNNYLVQTITAACTGDLTSVTVDVGNHSPGTFAVCEVRESCDGPSLASESFSVGAQGDVTINFATPAALVGGQTYYLRFEHPSFFGLRADDSGSYSGGEASCPSFDTWDIEFAYTIDGAGTGGGGGTPAQCTETSGEFGIITDSPDASQSFIAACSGELTTFTFEIAAAYDQNEGMGVVQIREGCNSTVLSTENVFFPNSTGGDITVTFTSPATVVAGQEYTARITPAGTTRFDGTSTDAYPNGSLNCQGQLDLEFSYTIGSTSTPPAAVPTMGEWALIILALIMMSLGVVTVMRWKTVQSLQTAGGNAQVSMNTGNSVPFNKKSYFQILPLVWVGLVAVFAIAVAAFGYEMTGADVPGALMAGAVGAYLIHLIKK